MTTTCTCTRSFVVHYYEELSMNWTIAIIHHTRDATPLPVMRSCTCPCTLLHLFPLEEVGTTSTQHTCIHADSACFVYTYIECNMINKIGLATGQPLTNPHHPTTNGYFWRLVVYTVVQIITLQYTCLLTHMTELGYRTLGCRFSVSSINLVQV